jgi:hypothetical protein
MGALYTSAKSRPNYTFDAELEFKGAGLIAADAAALVDAAARIVTVGTGLFEGDLIIDVAAVEIASGDERYTIILQGSTSATFASDIAILCAIPIGDGSTIGTAFGGSGVDVDDAVGRYVLPFRNERNGVYYPYLRLWTDVAGAIATGINYTAFAAPRQ